MSGGSAHGNAAAIKRTAHRRGVARRRPAGGDSARPQRRSAGLDQPGRAAGRQAPQQAGV
ncbi:hypothetical protein ADN00_03280 [Ornatilinea apprima]|uniref:Uncharacterized protein n=1 Tax=Ornatilinea apprima TaxID=1134406 RepID=A0A0P6Y2T2_9CHLR|nr:hypothetical protein ADN00_03280 [Ornatilinea apprima]